jgi:hypothetical protein
MKKVLSLLLICVTNIVCVLIGYNIGSKKEIITIQKGEILSHMNRSVDYDEEATYVTPEMELAYEEANKQSKGGEEHGMD